VTALDSPVRTLLAQVDVSTTTTPSSSDIAAIGAALAEFATDLDYLAPWVARLGGSTGGLAIHAPDRGPRLLLVHRPEGGMSAIHDHGTWVALATITGLETHRRYRRVGDEQGGPRPELVEEVALAAAQVTTLLPPDDIHDHGHLVGRGRPAHILVLTGDDQQLFTRTEWDLATGRRRTLRPGAPGRWLATDPFPEPDASGRGDGSRSAP
jgi:predicted metal-dependent enzyme (double-stranded beta helix superfamily)